MKCSLRSMFGLRNNNNQSNKYVYIQIDLTFFVTYSLNFVDTLTALNN